MTEIFGKKITHRCYHNPIFVIGASRSGTSALLQALGKHPEILAMPGEAPYIGNIVSTVYYFEFADNKGYYLDSIKVTKEYLYDCLRRISFEVAGGKNYAVNLIMKLLFKGDLTAIKKRYWAAKIFPDANEYKAIRQLYPAAKFVYIVRNGYDVVNSMSKFSGFRHQSFEENCKAWVHFASKFDYLHKTDSGITIRHERMLAEPDIVFRGIFETLGMKYNEGPEKFLRTTLVHPLDQATLENVNATTALQMRKPAYENWSAEQKKMFKDLCSSAMRKLGYEIPF
jgi:hypothetical protein